MFAVICVLLSLIALFCGTLMTFHAQAISSLGHGTNLLIRTSHSFAGLLLFSIGLLLLMLSSRKDWELRDSFAKGCTVPHVFVAV
ncbi:hypothetical protein ACJRO7_021399 [Eucalyptus globulus]|uniref:DUF7865 domain-containing protein n=1 Tax=Eucalyptus globulus TaxID=34317 RepID=A0ABD3KJZ0_EUCGL